MTDQITIKTSKAFISFWSKLASKIQEDETIKIVALYAWQGGIKEENKRIMEVIDASVK